MIDINQDWEVDYDGELLSRLPVFWAPGHGHNARKFIDAVVEYSLDETDSVPGISEDAVIEEVWQSLRYENDEVWTYDRRPGEKPPEYEAMRGRIEWQPVSLLDLDRRRPGAPKCSMEGCKEPWSSGYGVKFIATPSEDGVVRNSLRIRLCRAHMKEAPEPWYRLVIVPMNATIEMDPPEGSTKT